jgi:dTDP-4-dehydrorhamnose 3,5-epimerase-like enzyme
MPCSMYAPYFQMPKIVDDRGFFCKTYFYSHDFQCKEVFYTNSCRGVARGLHYQDFPNAASRTLHVLSGCILDFIVTFDPNTSTIMNVETCELRAGGSLDSASIPGDGRHCHGFIALEDSVCLYISSETYSHKHDKGFDLFSLPFRFDSLAEQHNLSIFRSQRDTSLPTFSTDD